MNLIAGKGKEEFGREREENFTQNILREKFDVDAGFQTSPAGGVDGGSLSCDLAVRGDGRSSLLRIVCESPAVPV